MFLGAALYTSVGHGGASEYIALMALFGLAPAVMRPTALALNILVASFKSFRYLRAGLFRWRTLWPFLIGGARLLWSSEPTAKREPRDPPIVAGVLCGAGIGLLSG